MQELVGAGALSHGTRLRQKGHVESLMNPALGAFLFPIFHYEITAPTLSSNFCLERVEKHQPSPFANHLRIPSVTTNQRPVLATPNNLFSLPLRICEILSLCTPYNRSASRFSKLLFPPSTRHRHHSAMCKLDLANPATTSEIYRKSAQPSTSSPLPPPSLANRIHSYRILPRNQTGPHGFLTRPLGRLNMR